MNELVSIIIPIRERIEKPLKCIGLIRKNTYYKSYEIIVVVDSDDKKVLAARHEFGRGVRWKIMKDRQGYICKVNAGFKVAKGKYLQIFGDDVEVHKRWLTNAIECFNKSFPDGIGVLALNDGQYNDRLAIHPFVSRKWIDTYQHGKWFQQPEYIHYHGDLELTLIAKSIDKFVYSPEAVALHIRPQNAQERDSLWWYGHMKFWKRDSSVLEGRMQEGFIGYGPKKIKIERIKIEKYLSEATSSEKIEVL